MTPRPLTPSLGRAQGRIQASTTARSTRLKSKTSVFSWLFNVFVTSFTVSSWLSFCLVKGR